MAAKFTIPTIFTAVDRLSSPLDKMTRNVGRFGAEAEAAFARTERRLTKFRDAAFDVSKKAAIVGTAITAPLALAANEAIKFEDKLADVSKTTGLNGAPLKEYGQDVLALSSITRTATDDLLAIGEIGGQFGVATNELVSFTVAADKFNVALGKDFGGVEEAIASVSKIKNLFPETRALSFAEAINRTGSAINELGAQGAATSPNIADFTQRIGALPDALKPALNDAQALGAYFEELGLTPEIAAGGLTKFLLDAGGNIGKFAAQMKMSAADAKVLLAQNPTEFTKRFAATFNGLAPDVLAKKLAKLKIGSQESIKVLGALGSNTARLTDLQNISNDSFAKATSLNDEFNKKNNTTAAQIAKAQNNFKAFAITVGTELIPVVSDLLKAVLPVVKGVTNWMKANPKLTRTILMVAVGIAGLAFAVSGISFAMGVAAQAVMIFNAALAMNPIVWVAAAIVLAIGVMVLMIEKWEDWGAAVSLMMGPLGLVISAVMSLGKHWNEIKEAFTAKGFIAGIKQIGIALLDAVVFPIQQALFLLGKLTGSKAMMDSAVIGGKIVRQQMGVSDEDNNFSPEGYTSGIQSINPKAAQNAALSSTISESYKQMLTIDFKNMPAGVTTDMAGGSPIPNVTTTSTK